MHFRRIRVAERGDSSPFWYLIGNHNGNHEPIPTLAPKKQLPRPSRPRFSFDESSIYI